MTPIWLVPLGRCDRLMVSVDLVQQEHALDSLEESDLHDLRGRGAPCEIGGGVGQSERASELFVREKRGAA